jgi:hypothetical protein
MSFSTFSGPVLAGTERYNAGTVNTGAIELVQYYTIPTAAILTSPAALDAFRLPAGSRIMEFTIEVTTAITTATNCGIVFGKSGTANFYMTSVNSGTTAVKTSPATIAAAMACNQTTNVGTADITITVTPTAAGSNAGAGEIVVGVRYIQRLADGTFRPAGVNI